MKLLSLDDLDSWIEFKSKVMAMYPFYFDNLREAHSDLTALEIKLCTLIIMECGPEELTQLLGGNRGRLYNSRWKIREKLGLDEDINLSAYLAKLAVKPRKAWSRP